MNSDAFNHASSPNITHLPPSFHAFEVLHEVHGTFSANPCASLTAYDSCLAVALPEALSNIRSAISSGLAHAATVSTQGYVRQYPGRAEALKRAVVLCPEELSLRTLETYTRQDKRDLLKDKVRDGGPGNGLCYQGLKLIFSQLTGFADICPHGSPQVTNYDELKLSWSQLCTSVARNLDFPDPIALCLEASWRLPD